VYRGEIQASTGFFSRIESLTLVERFAVEVVIGGVDVGDMWER
jgi:hypothetical protein